MILIEPSLKILMSKEEALSMIKKIELMGRICYQSQGKITEDSYIPFIRSLIKRNHTSVLEHGSISVIIECSRSVSHEIVRHRVGCSYCQESQRYVNYSNNMKFLKPLFNNGLASAKLESVYQLAEQVYRDLLEFGFKPEEARECLPNATKSELGMTYTITAWRHFFKERGTINVLLQTRLIAIMILKQFKEIIPVLFDDFIIDDVKRVIEQKS